MAGRARHHLMLLKFEMYHIRPIQLHTPSTEERAKGRRLKSQSEGWLRITMTTRSEQEKHLTHPKAIINLQHKNITYPA